MIIVLLGPPGAGKGTQTGALVKRYHLLAISTGDIFRANLTAGTPLGLEAKSYMSQGLLVPDDLTVRLVVDRLAQPDAAQDVLLDGFPRTVYQAEELEKFLASRGQKVDHCLLLDIQEKELTLRLTGRRVCRSCHSVWHLSFSPPPADLVCPSCGGEIYQRDDDKEAAVSNRLKVYQAQTQPVANWYKQKGLLRVVNASGQPLEVEKAIEKALSQGRPQK
ncbi:MAG: adenylate kinase [Deltaproteobacteria bacterium]|jgi:adenylate kinase|nr:adenylate kinase [Deltaproteobacteria bacterium]